VASKGRTVTDQMARVVETALGHSETFGHEDVVAALQGKASRATVYRTLAKMVEAGVLRQVKFNDREGFVVTGDD
jgi:Fe2+ or Zn2+ uptake regulation protein